ncbi:Na(+)-translocating NADH-quinone reductase subunit F [Flagellimonas sp. SN16]|uniref:Na(+)-translocating NADH-quinone reductase subunit F n=1 Tax=Flagellimonas sp. SN16 TaxID=3415142 RepID=UPI003C3503E6
MSTERFEKAVTKLYRAFHEGTLNAFSCEACAVGNIAGGKGWSGLAVPERVNVLKHDYMQIVNKGGDIDDYNYPEGLEYSPSALYQVELRFLTVWEDAKNPDGRNKELQFKGLCAVVEYLCELDNIPNVMDYSSLFEYDEKGVKKELQTVFP